MKTGLMLISIISLLGILISALLVFMGKLPHSSYILYTTVATVIWFLASPFWLAPKKISP